MKKFFATIAAVASLALCASGASASETLSLADCLDIAEAYHPSLAGAAASVSADIAKLRQAAVGDRLTISGTLSSSRSGGDDKEEGSSFSVGANAGIKIYDSGRSAYRIEAARETVAATREGAEQTLRDVRASVKTAYTDLLLYAAEEAARAEAVAAYEQHLEQARGFFDAGTHALYDVTQAEVNLGNARGELVRAQSNVVTGRAALLGAMGVTIAEEFDLAPISWDILGEIMDRARDESGYWELSSEGEARAIEAALENRADYRADLHRLASSRASLAATARQGSPSVSLSGGYSGSGYAVGNINKGWNGGLSVSIPIVDGGEAAAALDGARASLAALEASHEEMRQRIILDVRRALNDLRTARERIDIAEIVVASAEENRRLAVGRYETGVGSALEVTDALVSLTNAYLSRSQAHNALEQAVIGMEKVLGIELTELDETDDAEGAGQ